MKKTICVLLIIVCLLFFASCGKNENSSTPPTELQDDSLPLTVTVTFPEGFTLVQIAERLQENNVCTAADFIELTNDRGYLKTLTCSFLGGIDNPKKRPFILEGYIFPDTYEFYTGEGAEAALKRFLDNTETKLTDAYKTRAAELGYSMDEILTLASIIQEEAGEVQHMADVSSVLHNRLNNEAYGILQCDVTINYINDAVKDSPYINKRVSTVSKNYNTYKCYGLPLGPITNPGIHAIEAALYPADTNYYFFVTDAAWNYYYAETYEEHQANCEIAGIY